MINVELINWKTLKDQFGLTDTTEGVKSARQLHKALKNEVLNKGVDSPIIIPCNTKSEAVAIFVFVNTLTIKGKPATYVYEYTGTAN